MPLPFIEFGGMYPREAALGAVLHFDFFGPSREMVVRIAVVRWTVEFGLRWAAH